jgi:hypothetical protein
VRASVAAISDALLDASQHEEAWTVAKGGLAQVDAPSLPRLQRGKLAARTGLRREEGLAMLDQVLRKSLESGSGSYNAGHWREGQVLKDLGRKAEMRLETQQVLRKDNRNRGADELEMALGE